MQILPTYLCRFAFLMLSAAATQATSANAEPALRAFAGDGDYCFLSGPPPIGRREAIEIGPALVAKAGEALVKSSISTFGRYLHQAAQSTSSPLMTTITDVDMFRVVKSANDPGAHVELNLECLVVVSGDFGILAQNALPPAFVARAAQYDPDQLFVKRTNDAIDTKLLSRLELLDLPKTYFEFIIEHHRSAPALRLSPVYAYFRESNASLNAQNLKNVEITVSFVAPTSTGTLDLTAVSDLDNRVMHMPIAINRIKAGTVRKVAVPKSNVETVWVSEPKFPKDEEIQAVKHEIEAIGGVRTVWPANVFVSYQETDKPNLFLDIAAGVLSGSSSAEK